MSNKILDLNPRGHWGSQTNKSEINTSHMKNQENTDIVKVKKLKKLTFILNRTPQSVRSSTGHCTFNTVNTVHRKVKEHCITEKNNKKHCITRREKNLTLKKVLQPPMSLS